MMRALALSIAVAACGPIAYVDQVTVHADDAVEAARVAQADKYSPYYWTRATQYLHMARVVAAHADFQGANRFGRLAEEAAEKAKAEAEDKRAHPVPVPVPVPVPAPVPVPVPAPAVPVPTPAPAEGTAP